MFHLCSKYYQYKSAFLGLIVLVFLGVHANASARSISFDPGFSEFLLKNASPLISQIQKKSGIGYESLKNQLQIFGCDTQLLTTPNLSQQKNDYAFHQTLIDSLVGCDNASSAKRQHYEFQNLLKNKDAYLIVTGESLNSPMSYFGHSLLLFLDKENFYFSPVISVLAPTEGLSTFEQVRQGGFSFIQAETNAIPLHQVIDFYSDQDSRKLKFIKLPTSKFDSEKLIDFFDQKLTDQLLYNFFTQNCSTYLYRALNYSCNCFPESPLVVTPVLLERLVLEYSKEPAQFIVNSLFDRFNQSYGALAQAEKNTVESMFLSNAVEYPVEKKSVGDVAVLASMLSFESYHRPNSAYNNLLDSYGKDDSLLESFPKVKGIDHSHFDSLSISSATIAIQEKSTHLTLSAIDFDHFEQRADNFISSKLSAGSIELSQTEDSMQLESLKLINILSITPLNFVTRKPSWQLKVGVKRNELNKLEALISMGVGPAFSLSKLKLYSLLSAEMQSSLEFPVYTGIQFKSELLSVKYELKDLTEHSLSFYRRESSSLGYEYKASKKDKIDVLHQLSLSYYF